MTNKKIITTVVAATLLCATPAFAAETQGILPGGCVVDSPPLQSESMEKQIRSTLVSALGELTANKVLPFNIGFLQQLIGNQWSGTRTLDINAIQRVPQKANAVDFVNGIMMGADANHSLSINDKPWAGKTTADVQYYDEGKEKVRMTVINGKFEGDGRVMTTRTESDTRGNDRAITGSFRYGKKNQTPTIIGSFAGIGVVDAENQNVEYAMEAETTDGKYTAFSFYETNGNNTQGKLNVFDSKTQDLVAEKEFACRSNEPPIVVDIVEIEKTIAEHEQEK